MFIIWGGLTVLYGISFVNTYFIEGDAGGAVMGLLALLFFFLTWRSYQKRKQKHMEDPLNLKHK